MYPPKKFLSIVLITAIMGAAVYTAHLYPSSMKKRWKKATAGLFAAALLYGGYRHTVQETTQTTGWHHDDNPAVEPEHPKQDYDTFLNNHWKKATAGIVATALIYGGYRHATKQTEELSPWYDHKATVDQKHTVLFLHGLVDDHTQAHEYFKETDELKKRHNTSGNYLHDLSNTNLRSVQFDYGNGTLAKFLYASRSTLAQSKEIERVNEAYNGIDESNSVLLDGTSNGASVGIGFVAKYNPRLAGMILQAPYDSVKGVIQENIKNENGKRYAYAGVQKLFPGHNPSLESPIEQIKYIHNKDLPILIVCSKKDWVVPYKSTVRVYKEFVTQGFVNAYILITKAGKHAKILWGPDGKLYQNVVHAFKKKYHIPGYNESFANAGLSLLEKCQLSLEQVNKILE